MGEAIVTYATVAALAIAVLYAAFTDVRERRIGNRLCLAILALAPFFWWANGLSIWPGVAMQIGMGVAAFFLGALLFKLGQVGGGDVKLLTAIALCVEPMWFLYLLLFTGLANGVLTVLVVWRHRRKTRAGTARGKVQVPYAVSVAFAMLFVLVLRYGPAFEAGLQRGAMLS